MSSEPHVFPASPVRRGFTILELLISMGVVTVLAALVLPAIGSAREMARGVECVSRLRQTGVALHAHHDQRGQLPVGWSWEPEGKSAYGWAVELLPFMEQQQLYRQISRDQPLDQQAGFELRRALLPMFLCPSDVFEPLFVLYEESSSSGPGAAVMELPTASFVGVFGTKEADDGIPAPLGDGVFLEDQPVRFSEITRGLSNTLCVGERTAARVPSTWLGVPANGEDAACRLVGSAFTSPNCNVCDECEFGSRHPGGSNFLWGDGRVTLVSENISTAEYRMLARRNAE